MNDNDDSLVSEPPDAEDEEPNESERQMEEPDLVTEEFRGFERDQLRRSLDFDHEKLLFLEAVPKQSQCKAGKRCSDGNTSSRSQSHLAHAEEARFARPRHAVTVCAR